jgi:hypothetical protein
MLSPIQPSENEGTLTGVAPGSERTAVAVFVPPFELKSNVNVIVKVGKLPLTTACDVPVVVVPLACTRFHVSVPVGVWLEWATVVVQTTVLFDPVLLVIVGPLASVMVGAGEVTEIALVSTIVEPFVRRKNTVALDDQFVRVATPLLGPAAEIAAGMPVIATGPPLVIAWTLHDFGDVVPATVRVMFQVRAASPACWVPDRVAPLTDTAEAGAAIATATAGAAQTPAFTS